MLHLPFSIQHKLRRILCSHAPRCSLRLPGTKEIAETLEQLIMTGAGRLCVSIRPNLDFRVAQVDPIGMSFRGHRKTFSKWKRFGGIVDPFFQVQQKKHVKNDQKTRWVESRPQVGLKNPKLTGFRPRSRRREQFWTNFLLVDVFSCFGMISYISLLNLYPELLEEKLKMSTLSCVDICSHAVGSTITLNLHGGVFFSGTNHQRCSLPYVWELEVIEIIEVSSLICIFDAFCKSSPNKNLTTGGWKMIAVRKNTQFW